MRERRPRYRAKKVEPLLRLALVCQGTEEERARERKGESMAGR